MKKISKVIAALGLAVMGLGIFGNLSASADSGLPAKLTDNPDSPVTIAVKHKVKNGLGYVNNSFTLNVTELNEGREPSGGGMPTSVTLNFNNVDVDENNEAVATGELNFRYKTFPNAGTYKFEVSEVASSNADTYPVDTNKFIVFIDVASEVDENGYPTGEYKATLSTSAKNETTGEKGEIEFVSEPKLTYSQLDFRVRGAKARRDVYFPYTVRVETDDEKLNGVKVNISGLDATYTTMSRDSRSQMTYVELNTGATTIWLKDGQSAKIGFDGENNRLPIGARVLLTSVKDGLTDNYDAYLDGNIDNDQLVLTKTLAAVPGVNASQEILEAFGQTNVTKAERALTDAAVSTGVAMYIVPFVVIVMASGAAFVAYKKSKGKESER